MEMLIYVYFMSNCWIFIGGGLIIITNNNTNTNTTTDITTTTTANTGVAGYCGEIEF